MKTKPHESNSEKQETETHSGLTTHDLDLMHV